MARTPRRTRKRTLGLDSDMLVERAVRLATEGEDSRTEELNAAQQRYAKYRQWRSGDRASPWNDASDAAVSDMMTASLRIQDTIYNAVISTRPTLTSKAVHEKDQPRQDTIDTVLDYQAFTENGEAWLGETVELFANDGHFTHFVPWIDEKRKVSEAHRAPPIPPDAIPGQYFVQLLQMAFGAEVPVAFRGDTLEESWDFTVGPVPPEQQPVNVAFYTEADGTVEMVVERTAQVFLGPKIIVKDRSEVLHPANVCNLQIPGPSNPGGSPWVILWDRPTVDEIARLQRQGFYDELTAEDVKKLIARDEKPEESKEQAQRSVIQGNTDMRGGAPRGEDTQAEQRVTRYLCFDIVAAAEGGVTEDVVYWVLKEPKLLCRKRRLAEVYPSALARRPFGEGQFIPVKGQRTGIGILEIVEGLHDLRKEITDQMVNLGSLSLSPWFFYRPTSSMRQETIRLYPGEGYPLSDPKNDVEFPSLPLQGLAYGINMLTLLDQSEEKVTMQGDIQFGRVPKGKASALRTTGTMAMLQAQGDERPERILRRFYHGLAQTWATMHEANRHFMPPEKVVRVGRIAKPGAGEEAYLTVKREDMQALVEFEFDANIFNTSRAALQESLQALMGAFLSPLGFQAGVSSPRTVYQLFHDWAKAWGQQPEKYIESPFGQPLISFQEAMAAIKDFRMPVGFPMEGPMQHFNLMQQFEQSIEFGFLTEDMMALYRQWELTIVGLIQAMQEQAALAQAAGQNETGASGGEQGGGQPAGGNAPVSGPNELLNESLPGAGGGASEAAP